MYDNIHQCTLGKKKYSNCLMSCFNFLPLSLLFSFTGSLYTIRALVCLSYALLVMGHPVLQQSLVWRAYTRTLHNNINTGIHNHHHPYMTMTTTTITRVGKYFYIPCIFPFSLLPSLSSIFSAAGAVNSGMSVLSCPCPCQKKILLDFFRPLPFLALTMI